jgi:hypothetical protein
LKEKDGTAYHPQSFVSSTSAKNLSSSRFNKPDTTFSLRKAGPVRCSSPRERLGEVTVLPRTSYLTKKIRNYLHKPVKFGDFNIVVTV